MNIARFAHDGIEHQSAFEGTMHVLSQWIFIVAAAGVLVAGVIWLLKSQKKKG